MSSTTINRIWKRAKTDYDFQSSEIQEIQVLYPFAYFFMEQEAYFGINKIPKLDTYFGMGRV